MFSRKKKYDLSNTGPDSSSSSSSNGYHGNDHNGRNGFNNHTSNNNTGSHSSSGETLSKRKEQRRVQMFGTSSDVMSNRSSNSSLNRMSNIPLHDPKATETGTKSRVYPIFEQGTPLPRTVSNPCEHSKVEFASNGSAGQRINAARMVSDSKVDYYKTDNRFGGAQISQQSLGLQHHQSDGLETSSKMNQIAPGPTNIDDVIGSFQELNFKPADTTSLNTSLDLSTSSDNDNNINSNNNNNNSNANNNANIFTNSKQISNTASNIGNNINNNNIIQEVTSPQNKLHSSSFSLTNGQEEIKSLRQLRKAKPTTKVIQNIDFSQPSPTATTPPITATTISTSEPIINSVADKFEFQTPSTNDLITATNNNMLSSALQSSSEHRTNFKLSSELKQLEKQEIVEIENMKTDTTDNSFPSEKFDEKVTIKASSDTADMMIDTANITTTNNNNYNNNNNNNNNNMITNIDDECQKETSNEVHENIRMDTLTSKTDADNTNEQSKTNDSEEDNNINSPPNLGGSSTIGSIIYLQNNGVSRILIRNDTIAITRGDNVMQEISSNNRNFTTTDDLIEREQQSPKEFELINSKSITNDKIECDPNRTQTMKRDDDDDYVNDKTDDINSNTSENTEENNLKSMSNAIIDIHSQPNTPQVGNDTQLNDKSINSDKESTSQLKLSAPKKQPPPTTSTPPPPTSTTTPPPTSTTTSTTSTTVGKFKLNAGSLNFATKKESHRSKDGTNGKGGGGDDDGSGGDDNDEHEYFKRRRQETIEGRDGSFRGIKNIVRSGVSMFANNEEAQSIKTIMEQSRGKIIFFTTSMSVIRSTRDRCSAMKKLLQNHRIYFDERDVYISEENSKDLIQRFRLEKQKLQADGKIIKKNDKCGIASHLSNDEKVEYEEMLMLLPRVFVEDFDLGSYEEVFKLNETEVLKKIFSEFPKVEGDVTCEGCGGFRYTPCHGCHGSKRSRSNAFTEEFFSLRCTKCDENGLARCKTCNADLTSFE